MTPPGASAGLVVTLEREIRMPPRRRYTQIWAMQIAFLPGDRGYLLHDKPALSAVLAQMVVGVGFMAERLTPEDEEALSSLA
ncbi:hypothetical protein G3T14_19245 [Methylobacterium sp. BTF04]|uniref:hypothetical protein n=1 Tax=Methylobacterium sp. BTF04 TaxID=2708300 RepID=UPI0013D086C1|nr:hypothetical protein [Methylobacterium sp. BTF04]NEU14247.1 hypothetical protein [Methylobacterium sp. BTF04]